MRGKLLALALITAGLFTLGGCQNKESADEYVGNYIKEYKEKPENMADVLQLGIEETNTTGNYKIAFPEDATESYETFLNQALSQVEFKVEKAKKQDKSYKVTVYFEPIDILTTTGNEDEAYVTNMQSAEFTTELQAVLKQDTALLKDAGKEPEARQTITVTEKDGSYQVKKEDMDALVSAAVLNYMQPYDAVAFVFDRRDFLQAYLDASLKGDVTNYANHTGMTQEQAQKWYEDSFISDDLATMTAEQQSRLIASMKTIYAGCNYTLGIPRKVSLTDCSIEMKIVPNTTLVTALDEIKNGTYYSEEEVNEAFVSTYEKYAAAQTYGQETSTSFVWGLKTQAQDVTDDSEIGKLVNTIITSPQS